jgi:hypothetical protein
MKIIKCYRCNEDFECDGTYYIAQTPLCIGCEERTINHELEDRASAIHRIKNPSSTVITNSAKKGARKLLKKPLEELRLIFGDDITRQKIKDIFNF